VCVNNQLAAKTKKEIKCRTRGKGTETKRDRSAVILHWESNKIVTKACGSSAIFENSKST